MKIETLGSVFDKLDELGVIKRAVVDLARDLLHTSERCHPHDPELAAKFLSKADEICRDFNIDRALIDPMLNSQSDEMPAETIIEMNIVESADLDAENMASTRALNHILNRQREVIGDQFWNAASDVKSEQRSRSLISSISQWFGRLQSARMSDTCDGHLSFPRIEAKHLTQIDAK